MSGVISTALRHLMAAGVTGEALLRAVEDMEAAIPKPVDEAAERRRERDRIYQAERRRQKSADSADKADEGFLDKESPQTPKKIILPREIDSSPAREALGVLSEVVDALVAAHLKRWKDLPPPPGVSDEQWAGFLDHRKAHPKGGKFTAYAYKLLCRKLVELAEDGWPPGEMIDLAIERRWITVFAPKDFQHGRTNGMGRDQSGDGLGRTARAAIAVFGPRPGHPH